MLVLQIFRVSVSVSLCSTRLSADLIVNVVGWCRHNTKLAAPHLALVADVLRLRFTVCVGVRVGV